MRLKKLIYLVCVTSTLVTCIYTVLFAIIQERKNSLDNITKNSITSLHSHVANSNSVTEHLRRLRGSTGKYGSCSTGTVIYRATTEKSKEKVYPYFKDSFEIKEKSVVTLSLEESVKAFCDNNVRIFANHFAILHDVILDNSKRMNADKNPKGGEYLKDVLGQSEASEFFKFTKGFWSVRCNSNDIQRNEDMPWLEYLDKAPNRTHVINDPTKYIFIDNNVTLAITRGDYVNLHNVIRQFYNAFILMVVFKKQPKDVSVLFVDGHPAGSLDQPWADIFRQVTRVGRLSQPVMYKTLIWGLKETDGGLSDLKSNHLAYGEEFRSFFLQGFSVNDTRNLSCSCITITLNLRRDKLFHPRNTNGIIGRKIFNDEEIIGDLIKVFPNACIQGILMDMLPMQNQLEIASTTDIFIGMHGAGMTHMMFLPKHAAVLEIFPKDFKVGRPHFICFQKIAQWRGLKYDSWENFDKGNELPYDYTILPSGIIMEKVKGLMNTLCPSNL